jgi:hypothetical protein
MGKPPEFRLNRGVDPPGEREGEEENKPGWVPAPGGGQSVLSPVPEVDVQEGTMMDETEGEEVKQNDEGGVKEAEGTGVSEPGGYHSAKLAADRSEESVSRGSWRLPLGGAKEWGAASIKKDLNAGWGREEKQALSDFRPGAAQWGPQAVQKWGVYENGAGANKPAWSPQGKPGSAKGLSDGFGTSPRPKGMWGNVQRSPPPSAPSHPGGRQRSPQWKGGATHLMEDKDDPLSPGEAMSPGWGPNDSEDFPPLRSGGKGGLGVPGQGERKVVWKPRLKANSLELTSSPDYGSFTDKGSYMQVGQGCSHLSPALVSLIYDGF